MFAAYQLAFRYKDSAKVVGLLLSLSLLFLLFLPPCVDLSLSLRKILNTSESSGVTNPGSSNVVIARPALSVLRAMGAGHVLAEGSRESAGKREARTV